MKQVAQEVVWQEIGAGCPEASGMQIWLDWTYTITTLKHATTRPFRGAHKLALGIHILYF